MNYVADDFWEFLRGSMRKRLLMGLRLMGLVAMIAGLLSSCAASGDLRPSQNLGDMIVARLHVGMKRNEIEAAIGDLRKYVMEDDFMAVDSIKSEQFLYMLYGFDYFPRDILRTFEVGTPYRILSYWTNYAGRDAGTLLLFFDKDTQRLRGWVNTPSEWSRDKFMHERITSQLKWSEGGAVKGMTHAQVHALIGEPVEIIAPPQDSRALYENHFWVSGANFFRNQKIEVYSYALDSGEKRHVYLLYYPAADELNGWGYDHAWEEAERYQREQGGQKK
ncbi:MAG: hypothetical protein V4528_02710 [Pseudomonadota bacterium]